MSLEAEIQRIIEEKFAERKLIRWFFLQWGKGYGMIFQRRWGYGASHQTADLRLDRQL